MATSGLNLSIDNKPSAKYWLPFTTLRRKFPFLRKAVQLSVPSMDLAKDLLTDLVSFPVFGGMSNRSIYEYIRGYLERFDLNCEEIPNEDGSKAGLLCRIGPPVDGGIVLSGHMDVVPVAGQNWSSDPFELVQRDDKLYGRGACDMKGFIACSMAVVPKMVKLPLLRPIYLAFSYDEEIGCLAGDALAAGLKQRFSETPQAVIVGEPSMLQPVIGHKGICFFETDVSGSAGHSSRIRQDVSAIHEAARLTRWLEDRMNRLVEAGHLDDRFTPPHSSLHVGIFKGGIAQNVIADHCQIGWDIRNLPSDDLEAIEKEFRHYCQELEAALKVRFAGARIQTKALHPPVPSFVNQPDAPVVQLIQQLLGPQRPTTVAYASEAGQFMKAGFDTVICGPGSIDQAHRPDEFIHTAQLAAGVQFIERLALWSCSVAS